MAELTWLGHGTWQIQTEEHTILLDPFLDQNPAAPVKAADVEADYILVSHGHFDHIADAGPIALRTGATIIACHEIATWFQSQHGIAAENAIGMNLGGGVDLPFGRLTITVAHHSSQLPDGSYGGNPAGFVLALSGRRIYFACDTALFSDMKLISAAGIDLAVLPIGDHYTMGPAESIQAIQLVQPKRVAPAHYNTWPPIAQDAEAWAKMVSDQTDAQPIVVQPGGTISV